MFSHPTTVTQPQRRSNVVISRPANDFLARDYDGPMSAEMSGAMWTCDSMLEKPPAAVKSHWGATRRHWAPPGASFQRHTEGRAPLPKALFLTRHG
jgi:hypothetical protein